MMMIPLTARIPIERTKTNREALQIEDTYFPKIKRIFKKIIKEYGEGKIHLLPFAEKRYGAEIETLIKSMVTKTYLLGMEYVARATGKPEYVSISTNDVTQIMLQTDESYRMFWRLVTKYLQVLKNRSITRVGQVISYRKAPDQKKDVLLTDELFQVSDWDDDRLLDLDTNVELIISGVVTTTLALGTLQKFKDYKTVVEEEEQLIVVVEEEEESIEFELIDEEGDKYVWATEMDDRVCDDCSMMEGEEWDIDDPDIELPPMHPNCRCRILISIGGDIINK